MKSAVGSVSEWVDLFIEHSPDFYNDVSRDDIDAKHRALVEKAYDDVHDISLANFRNWRGQSDLTTPVQLNAYELRHNGFFRALARYLFVMTFQGFQNKCNESTIRDDLNVLKRIGADHLLIENPVSETPGVKHTYKYGGYDINQRWLRYIYLLYRIMDMKALSGGDVWVDVGSYYGGLQGLVKRYVPGVKMVLVDFHHQLCRSYIYLRTLYPEVPHIFPDQVNDYGDLSALPEGSVMYVPETHFSCISSGPADLVTNFFSLGEMRRGDFRKYMSSRLFLESKLLYLVNRFVSAPFFEKTYDSDLDVRDYVGYSRSSIYFDVFPMHHYALIKRIVGGHSFYRNISSPYFEMVLGSSE